MHVTRWIIVLGLQIVFCASNFDYFTLSQFWPGDFCLAYPKKRCEVPEEVRGWTIHGLWPDSDSGHFPQFCGREKFNATAIAAQVFAMTSQEVAKKHEWKKHGTCSISLAAVDTQQKYFKEILDLHSKFDVGSFLTCNGVLPDNTTTTEKIVASVETAVGVINSTTLSCVKVNDTFYLHELRLCVDKSFKVFSCPKRRQTFTSEDSKNWPTPTPFPCPSDETPIYMLPIRGGLAPPACNKSGGGGGGLPWNGYLGAIVGFLAAILVMLIVVGVVYVCKRRNNARQDGGGWRSFENEGEDC